MRKLLSIDIILSIVALLSGCMFSISATPDTGKTIVMYPGDKQVFTVTTVGGPVVLNQWFSPLFNLGATPSNRPRTVGISWEGSQAPGISRLFRVYGWRVYILASMIHMARSIGSKLIEPKLLQTQQRSRLRMGGILSQAQPTMARWMTIL